jgi:DNA replication and repair protein RecF
MVQVNYEAFGYQDNAVVELIKGDKAAGGNDKISRKARLNGVAQKAGRRPTGRLCIVSFAARDLDLLRAGPLVRRDWLDAIALKIRPQHAECLDRYEKILAQRNRLIKQFFESGMGLDEDQMKIWDRQAAYHGAQIVKVRIDLIAEMQEPARQHLSHISGQTDMMQLAYLCKADPLLSLEDLSALDIPEIARMLYRKMKERRQEELARRQSLVGPHRDDLLISIGGLDASAFASQGQQRSVVLALKLAELDLVVSHLQETPVLLLDDVLAELDPMRQRLLMERVSDGMQTFVTTTHLDGFREEWLKDAQIVHVHGGSLK